MNRATKSPLREPYTLYYYGSFSESEEWRRFPSARMGNGGSWRPRLSHVLWILTSGLLVLVVSTFYFRTTGESNNEIHSSPEEMLTLAHVSLNRYPKEVRVILKKLNAKMTGNVLSPSDAGFDEASTFFNEISAAPIVVVQAANTADVQLAVPVLGQLSDMFGIPWQVKAGGHKYTGFDGGIVLSVSRLNSFKVEYLNQSLAGKALATFGPGTTVGQILETCLVGEGFGGVLGSASSVAMGGFITGGGIGLWSRKYGMAIDHVKSMQAVLANGTVATTSLEKNEDLFWAMRGAGQDGFAVVTEFEYELWPTSSTQLIASFTVPVTDLASFLTSVGNAGIPGEVFIEVNSDDLDIEVTASWYGEDEASLARGETFLSKVLPTFVPSNGSEFSTIERVSILEAAREEEAFNGHLVQAWNGFLMPADNTAETWENILNIMQKLRSPYVMFDIELFGGAIAQVDATSTPYFWRQALYNVGIIVLVPLHETHAHHKFSNYVELVQNAWPEVAQVYLHGSYSNYAMASLDYHRHRASDLKYGNNLARLQSIKASVDPDDVFRGPQSVPSLK